MEENEQLPVLKKKLKIWGADPDSAIAFMLGDTQLYLRLLGELARDKEINELSERIDARDYENAFAMAHSLKGSTSTLGLTPLYSAVSALTEDLRDPAHIRPQLPRDREIYEIERKLFLEMMEEGCSDVLSQPQGD